MTTLAVKIEIPYAISVHVSEEALTVELDDGRTVSIPTAWYPRLLNASKIERSDWRLIGNGRGIHWKCIDEDISVEGILAGRPSGETQSSLKKWLDSRIKK